MSEKDSEKSRQERREKSWRHRDRELQGTHALSATCITFNGILLAAFSFSSSDDDIYVIAVFFVFVIASITLLLWNIYVYRELDITRAKYFEDSVTKSVANNSQHQEDDENYHNTLHKQHGRSVWRERFSFTSSFGALIILMFTI